MKKLGIFVVWLLLLSCLAAQAQDARRHFSIYQFPADQIPRIDGKADDWASFPDSLAIGMEELIDDNGRFPAMDTTNLNVKVKVAWVKGLNRLYFLYEAYDNYWNFSRRDLQNDIFELVVDGDRSGGPFIDRFHPDTSINRMDAYFSFHGVQAQNYHIFTPPGDKDWAMYWGNQTWLKALPYAQAAYDYHFQPGEDGRLTLEFYITPFDYASPDGPAHSVVSQLHENKTIGLSWAVIDYDDVNSNAQGFWILSRERTMYGNASYLLPFTLLPLAPDQQAKLQAAWYFRIDPADSRRVYFRDESLGEIQSWHWDFGDGSSSTDQHPVHVYQEPGLYIVTLSVQDTKGEESVHTKVWDVAIP